MTKKMREKIEVLVHQNPDADGVRDAAVHLMEKVLTSEQVFLVQPLTCEWWDIHKVFEEENGGGYVPGI